MPLKRLVTMIAERGHRFTTSGGMEIVREMKEKLAHVVPDSTNEPNADEKYELPDGQVTNPGQALGKCLQRPELIIYCIYSSRLLAATLLTKTERVQLQILYMYF